MSTVLEHCENGNFIRLKKCIDSGHSLNVTDRYGFTPLMNACWKGYHRCVRLLIDANVDLDAQNNTKDTALIMACRRQHDKCVKLLIDAGASPNIMGFRHDTPTNIASAYLREDYIRMFIKAGLNFKPGDLGRRGHIAQEVKDEYEHVNEICKKYLVDDVSKYILMKYVYSESVREYQTPEPSFILKYIDDKLVFVPESADMVKV